MLVPILMGSKSDQPHAERIAEALASFGVRSEMYVASAHKVPELCLDIVNEFNKSDDEIVYVTMAGRSNALSGFVAANAIHPVVACPPFSDKSDYLINIHSTLNMPSDTPCMTVIDPQNAAMAVLRILALTDKKLKKAVREHIDNVKEKFNN